MKWMAIWLVATLALWYAGGMFVAWDPAWPAAVTAAERAGSLFGLAFCGALVGLLVISALARLE